MGKRGLLTGGREGWEVVWCSFSSIRLSNTRVKRDMMMSLPTPPAHWAFLSHSLHLSFCSFHISHITFFQILLCRLWRQHAINRILISTNPVPDEIPINIKRPLDVFINGLPVVSVCCVVRMDMDGCGAADFVVIVVVLCTKLLYDFRGNFSWENY